MQWSPCQMCYIWHLLSFSFTQFQSNPSLEGKMPLCAWEKTYTCPYNPLHQVFWSVPDKQLVRHQLVFTAFYHLQWILRDQLYILIVADHCGQAASAPGEVQEEPPWVINTEKSGVYLIKYLELKCNHRNNCYSHSGVNICPKKSETVSPDQPENFQNCLSKFSLNCLSKFSLNCLSKCSETWLNIFKQCWRISSTGIALSI